MLSSTSSSVAVASSSSRSTRVTNPCPRASTRTTRAGSEGGCSGAGAGASSRRSGRTASTVRTASWWTSRSIVSGRICRVRWARKSTRMTTLARASTKETVTAIWGTSSVCPPPSPPLRTARSTVRE